MDQDPTPPATPLLSMTSISKRFDGVRVLHDVSLQVATAEVHALVGENGAGKSTLMKILCGIYPADAGSILLNGRSMAPRNYGEAVRAGISMIFQECSLFESLSVAENIFLERLPTSSWGLLSYGKLFQDAHTLLRELEFKISPATLVKDLSVGERQLVEIAKAISTGTKLIIMDEPTASLNSGESERLFRLIGHLKETSVAIVYISHRLDEIKQLSDSLTVLRDGQIVGTWQTSAISPQEVIQKMVGRSVDLRVRRHKTEPTDNRVALEVDKVSVPGKLGEVSFSLRSGEILGIAGLRGSGQISLVRALIGLERNYQGTILVGGRRHRARSPRAALALGLGYVTDDRKGEGLLPDRNASYNGTLGAIALITTAGFLRPRVEQKIGNRQAKDFAIRAGGASMPVKHFSGGNQQKVLLARALEQKPNILILNEPTCGIDIGAKEEIYRLIVQLASGGTSVLLVSSDLAELRALSDRILVINRKRSARIIPSELATDATVIEAAVT
jgi:ribose transport system ATP-binding protein